MPARRPSHRPARLVALLTSIALAALALVVVSAPPASGAGLLRMTSTERSYAASVLTSLNKQRAAHGRKPLRSNRFLVIGSDVHNRAMAAVNIISHQLPGEPAFNVRDWVAGYHYRCWAGENVGVHGNMDRRAALDLQHGMYDERPPENGHRLNILNRHYTEVGVAVLLDRVNHRLWLTVDFGSRC